ncbi:MAG: MFS transporter, partial [Ilumatobacteraceae bacterium]
QSFVQMIVDHDALPRDNGLVYAAEVVAGSLAGLALGALLFGASVGLPFVVNAVSFAIAAALIASVRTRPGADPPPTGGFDATSGLRSLREVPVLRVLAAMFALTNLGLLFGQGIFVKFASVELGLGPYGYGALLVVTALGAATGGLLGPALVDRFGTGVAVLAPFVVFGPAQFAIAWSGRVWAVGAAGFVLGGAIATWNVATVTLRQQVIPSERFGRVNSTYRWIGATASAIGIGSGGFVARATDLRAPFVVGGVLTAVTGVLFARPLLRSLAAS